MLQYPYRNLLGSLAFIAQRTRPDISYTVNHLSQFQANPGIKHWNALVRLLDADFAGNKDDRRSTSGNVIMLDEAIVSWKSKKQRNITLSTLESEYVSITECVKEVIYLQRVITSPQLRVPKGSYKILSDNLSAIHFTKNKVENSRTKHVDVKYHFVREYLEKGLFEISHVSGKDNLSDCLTKPPTAEVLKKFVEHIFIK